ncbi:MAG: NUDIX hydrolase [Paracoccaceae bacterium]|nr:NUDIX hydrolase [Paracoccaceae bacterium]
MIPRYGEPVDSRRRYRVRPGIYAVLLRGRDVLLTHQAEPIPEFQLPGGGVDPGENPISALHREVFEETGWTIGTPRRVGAFRRFTYMPEYDLWAEKVCQIYVARPARRIGPPTEAGHTEIWAPLEAAVELVANVGDRAFLERYL